MIGRDTEVDAGDAGLRLWPAAASGALVRPSGAFKRLCHRHRQKNTLHCCVVPSLLGELDPAALEAA
jgi:hypothetical protein